MSADTQSTSGALGKICKNRVCRTPIADNSRYTTCEACRAKRSDAKKRSRVEQGIAPDAQGFHTFRLMPGHYGATFVVQQNPSIYPMPYPPPAPFYPVNTTWPPAPYAPVASTSAAASFPAPNPAPNPAPPAAPSPPVSESESESGTPPPPQPRQRLCTTKKCRKPIPPEYAYRTCESCRTRKRSEHQRARARAKKANATAAPKSPAKPSARKKAKEDRAPKSVDAAERERMAALIRQMGGVPSWEKERRKKGGSGSPAGTPATGGSAVETPAASVTAPLGTAVS
ncbi:hypothetical protein GLOTRDRAFT_123152 [Gloeophyllum trabeum ATCC 11539]|uniref:Uncharacterized protein n=1 Tax=Gloeophyllum trabeum (strain ATCC 11539 / FP-39264 / Madison 617) TaxID=670483 RepID=S7RGC7_GLOTA|nr:uncharacterized protein GLOTRDRAFT_123152 [Gloeophyllum trabeum ATCC 11539]EPQ51584.1 hypothetical protein GLOTRDRAFT_123152 [Gloeophyllum trabeum ATCC 11539]